MAYLDLYVRTGGSNLNAGTTDTDSPSVTATCTYSDPASGQVTFTASSGTPFSGVSVGQWASILSGGEGASGSTFISQISAIGGSGASITVYTENGQSAVKTFFGDFSNSDNGIFGPSGTVTVRVGGAWANIVPMTTGAATSPRTMTYAGSVNSIRVNIKSGTYSSSAALTLVTVPTVGKPLFLRGYATTAGDLDNVANPGTHPVLSFSSTANLVMPAYTRLENIDVTTSGTPNPLVSVTGLGVMLTRCRVTATSGALTATGAAFNAWACYFATTSTTVTNTSCAANGGLPTFTQCVFQGGLYNVNASYTSAFLECVFKNSTSHNILASTASAGNVFHRCTFYNSGTTSDGILSATNINYHSITFCIFDTIKRYAVNSTNSSFVQFRLAGNDYSSITSGQLNGVYESYQHAAITESSSPFTSSSTNDFTLVSTSTAVTQTFVFEMP